MNSLNSEVVLDTIAPVTNEAPLDEIFTLSDLELDMAGGGTAVVNMG